MFGRLPELLPEGEAEVCEIVRDAAASGTALVPWGSGLHQGLGGPPRGLPVSMAKIAGVISHDRDDFVIEAEAGCTLGALADVLGPASQRLVFDGVAPETTVGGMVAAGLSPVTRLAHGLVRDQILGMRVVTGRGDALALGGRTLKNVSGYDMCRLHTGALGSLGVITSVRFRVRPFPKGGFGVVAQGGRRELAAVGATAAMRVWGLSAAMVWGRGGEDDDRLLAFGECVPGDAAELEGVLLGELAGRPDAVVTPAPYCAREARDAWLATGDGCHVEARLPPSELAGFLDVLPPGASFAALMGVGLCRIRFGRGSSDLERLRHGAESRGGRLVVLSGHEPGVDPWGGGAVAGGVVRRLKQAFDPAGILNPGRLPGRS